MDEFPLIRNNENTLIEIKKNIFTPNNITNQELPYFKGLIVVENKTIKKLGKISDYFQEHNRIKAKRFDETKTALEIWENNKNLSRDEIQKLSKECTNFCFTIFCSLIKIFKSKKILDFSSGWGDRLFGAMTYDKKINYYIGIDPNKHLQSGYNNMIRIFLPKSSHSKYQMINGCAEDEISLLDKNFDLIFTSPPYYDLEKYSDDENQSIIKYKNFEEWYNNFLLKSMKDAFDKLENYGIMAININNTKKYNIIDKLIKDIVDTPHSKFYGIIYFGDPKCKKYIFQPILIWEKNFDL